MPAFVQVFTQATSSQACRRRAATAATISPLVTLLHEQTCASSGMPGARPPPRAAGRISSSGLSGSAMPLATIGRSTPYAEASPTRIPPSRRVPSSVDDELLVDPGHRVGEDQLQRALGGGEGVAEARPRRRRAA